MALSRTTLLGVLLMACLVMGDIYMHTPRGSNDRNCERNVNRDNGNRLFNSQNNAKGGYACPRSPNDAGKSLRALNQLMTYYTGYLAFRERRCWRRTEGLVR
eukprot:Colp12_sorted_trinity150504_noHs@10396